MNTVFIFDIDGVITSPLTKTPNPTTIAFIAQQLQKERPLAIVTGRAISWIERRIITEINSKLQNNTQLDNLFISGEKGGVKAHFTNGKIAISENPHLSLPVEILQELKNRLKGISGIYLDEEKKTMLSIEIIGGEDKKEIEDQKKKLKSISIWIQETILPKYPDIVMEQSIISVDLQSKQAGKEIGGKEFVTFLKNKNIAEERFVGFGDSPSDIATVEAIFQEGYTVEFNYVGERPLTKKYNFPIYKPKDGTFYDIATESILKSRYL